MENFRINTDNLTEKAVPGIYLLKKYAKNTEFCENAENSISFIEDKKLNGDNYRIEKTCGSVAIYGNTPVAFNTAVGKLLRVGTENITSLSCCFDQDIRAVYFANHFHNYYHCAPIDEISEYLESLALWGQSVVWMWFDLHHFLNMETPEAQEMLERMKSIFSAAKKLGMKTALTKSANEYYEGGPKEALAENSPESGLYKSKMYGYYNTELCPSNKLGRSLIIKTVYDLFDSFSDIGIDYITLWPYDQGGCSCKKCYPYAGNGFYNLSKELASVIKKISPKTNVGISTWYFDLFVATECEFETFFKHFETEPVWLDFVVSNTNHSSMKIIKDKVPVISFPEISMSATPWGGFGAAPIPKKIANQLDEYATYCNGCMAYSEGIFEDLNKIVCLEKCRDKTRTVQDIVWEYCSDLVGKELAGELADLVFELETTLPRDGISAKGELLAYPCETPEKLHTYLLKRSDLVENIRNKFVAFNNKVPKYAKENWRYEILYLRALGDYELCKNNGVPNEATDKIYSRLVKIFHAETADHYVSPITRESIMTNRGRKAVTI